MELDRIYYGHRVASPNMGNVDPQADGRAEFRLLNTIYLLTLLQIVKRLLNPRIFVCYFANIVELWYYVLRFCVAFNLKIHIQKKTELYSRALLFVSHLFLNKYIGNKLMGEEFLL